MNFLESVKCFRPILFSFIIVFLGLPLSLSAQEKSKTPPGQIWHNGDREVPIWFADDVIAILKPSTNGNSLKALEESAQLLIPGAKVIRSLAAGSVVQLPTAKNAKEVLNSADTITQAANRFAAVYRSSPGKGDDYIIQAGELVVFSMPGISQLQIENIVSAQGSVSYLRTLIDGKAYLYSCPSDSSCLAIANNLYTLPSIKYAYPNWMKFRDKRGKLDGLETPENENTNNSRFTINDPLYSDQWHLSNTAQGNGTAGEDANVQGAHAQGIGGARNGTPVVIGVVDDGLDLAHEDLNFFTGAHIDINDGDNDPSPGSRNAHGTAVGGVAAADGFNGLGGSGVAPEAVLAGIRLIAAETTDVQEAQALNHELTTSDFIDIYNNSWGPDDDGNLHSPGPLTIAALENGVQTGREGAGAIYVWAGGNGLDDDDHSNYDAYANSRYTIAVGASTNTGVQSWYSESGSNLIVNAPSNGGDLGITTTDISGTDGYDTGNYTSTFGGTSSAAPLVSGVIALMFDVNPQLGWRDIQKILALSAERNDSTDGDWIQNGAGHWINHKYGFGRVDATSAVNMASNWINLPTEISGTTTIQPGAQIPARGNGPLTLTVPFQDSIHIQHVYVTIDSNHTYWGDLEMVLTSPNGTQSVLTETHSAAGASLTGGFTFSSMRHLDEISTGDWVLEITDGGFLDTGVVSSVELEVFGTTTTPPGKATLVSPSGTISDTTPTYTWNAVSGAAEYRLWVDDSTGTKLDDWHTAAAAGCSAGSGTCSITSSVALANGSGGWWIQTKNSVGNGPWSSKKSFTVSGTSIPGKATLVSPSGTISDTTPTYTWNAVSGATQYYLWVRDSSGDKIKKWYTASAAGCSSDSTCSITPSTTLASGSGTWWIQTWNSAGYGPWSSGKSFSVSGTSIPGKATLVSPSGTISDTTPTYTWNAVSGATQYYLWVRDSSGDKIKKWYTASAAGCSSDSTCSITPSTTLASGSGTWWIQTWNSAGYGPWSSKKSFSVSGTSIPGKATLISPSGTISDTTPTYTWNAVSGATQYYLWVRDSSGDKIKKWYTASAAGCSSDSTCSITPSTTLASGSGTWWIQTWNSAGYGPWSSKKSFTVSGTSIPGKATLVSPSGTISDATPTYTWNSVSGATQYYLWVRDSSGDKIKKWYTASAAGCSSDSTCSITPSTTLASGSGTWWIQTWNSAGYGPWSSGKSFSVEENSSSGFNSKFEGSMDGWQNIIGNWRNVSNSYLYTEGLEETFVSSYYQGNTFDNLDYTVRVWRDGEDDEATIVSIRGDASPGGDQSKWNNAYTFNFSRSGSFSVWKRIGNTATRLQDWTESTAFNQGSAFNSIRIWADGNSLWFAVNGTWVFNTTDSSLSDGYVGVGFYASDLTANNDKVWVDYATLAELDSSQRHAEVKKISSEQAKLNEKANSEATESFENFH